MVSGRGGSGETGGADFHRCTALMHQPLLVNREKFQRTVPESELVATGVLNSEENSQHFFI